MPLKTPNPNDTEYERKEKKKFNFFSKNWVSQRGSINDCCLWHPTKMKAKSVNGWPELRVSGL
jgi:hypothetical protein